MPATPPAARHSTGFSFLSPQLNLGARGGHTFVGIINFVALRTDIEQYLRREVPTYDAEMVTSQTPRVSVYINDLNTGAGMGIRERHKFLPMSLIKLPLAIAALRKVDRKEWRLDQVFILTEQDMDTRAYVSNTDSVRPGQAIALRDIIHKLLVDSETAVYHFLRRNLTDDEIEEAFYHIGMRFPEDANSPAVSPKNYATIFRSLYHSSYLTIDSSEYLLSVMSRTGPPSPLREAVPFDVPVSHKTGFYYPDKDKNPSKAVFLHDVGIIYFPGAPFLFSVMTTQIERDRAARIVRFVAAATYSYYERGNPDLRPDPR